MSAALSHAEVLVAVVHQDVDGVGLAGHLHDLLGPGPQLALVVVVAEALGRGGGPARPGVVGPAVEAHDDVVGRAVEVAGQLGDLGGVDRHQRQVVVGHERHRAVDVVGAEPAVGAELDAGGHVAEPLAGPGQLLAVVLLGREPGRVLEQDRAQLADLAERRQRLDEAPPHLVDRVVGQVVGVDVLLVARLGVELVADVGPQRLGLRGVPGHEAVGLHVHHEPLRAAVGPALGELLGGRPVVRAVGLHHREPGGVEPQAVGRRHRAAGVPVGVLRERLVGPRAGPDPHLAVADVQDRGQRRRAGVAALAGVVGVLGLGAGLRLAAGLALGARPSGSQGSRPQACPPRRASQPRWAAARRAMPVRMKATALARRSGSGRGASSAKGSAAPKGTFQ